MCRVRTGPGPRSNLGAPALPCRRLQPARHLGPVDDVPPGGDVVGPAVLVVEVVGVLPDVDAEDRRLALGERAVLVRRRHDGEAGAAPDEPAPAAAEAGDPGLAQLLLEGVEAPERGGDCAREV